MITYIVLLRGINIPGKIVKMDRLRSIFAAMGFQNVRTYIQSGNVLFEAEEQSTDLLAEQIVEELQKNFDFPIPVAIRTLNEWEEVIRQNPFPDKEPQVSFLSGKPSDDALDKVKSYQDRSDDEIQILGREVYLVCKGSYHKTLYSNAFLERNLQVSSTTRNWKTVNKLLDLSQKP
ncbi:MAG TPA: DUF1697 domain-containing protein [Bacillales bacterium]|nr:DUF1697 domain-containing protein [Bacillales bacterium]